MKRHMTWKPTVLFALVCLVPASAGFAETRCNGSLPAWSVTLEGQQAVLTTDREIALDLMDETRAEGGRDWPRALTLVGRDDTAILLIEAETCELNGATYDHQAQVLTQYGTVPILLTGCCAVSE